MFALHVLEAISTLPPPVEMLLIVCIFVSILFLLYIITFCPEGTHRLIELIRTLQRQDGQKRRYTERQQGRK